MKPEILSSRFDPVTDLEILHLRWESAPAERAWHLPAGVTITCPAPERFGVSLEAADNDSFHVRLAWNDLRLQWHGLSRRHIMASALAQILSSVGRDAWSELHRPAGQAA